MSLSSCWSRSKQNSVENKTLSTISLMDPPTRPAQNPNPNPSSVHADSIISSLLSFPASTPFSIACSFDRELEKALASASDDASVQDRLLSRAIYLASLLLESTKRRFRERASAHNSVSWVLPPELTVKVFSKLDTKCLMQVAACCIVFNKCAMDRSSYAHIDLTTATRQSDNEVVCTMIHRAGKELRSIKLGHVTRRYGPDPNPIWFNGPFLSSLSYNYGFLGSRLRSLRLYNIGPMNFNSLSSVLSVCSNLTDLRIVGSCCPFMNLFNTLSKKCLLIEHLCLVNHHPGGTMDASTASHLIELVTKSANLTSLTLIGFQVTNEMARNFVENSRKLKYLNLSRSPKINGRFLRDLGNSCKESPLKTLIMRNCVKLEENEVLELCNSLLKGNFKFIRHIDVSSNSGLVSDGGVRSRSYNPTFPLEKLKKERPDVTLVADFPLERSGKRYHVGVEGDDEELREIEMMEAKNDQDDDDEDSSSDEDDD